MTEEIIRFILPMLQATAALLIVLDPLGLMPLVLALTRDLTDSDRNRVVNQAILTGFGLLLAFTLTGTVVLSLFRVTIDDLRIAGGILLLVIALSLVLSGRTEPTVDAGARMVPLASPLLVGPGAITTSVVLVATNGVLLTSLAVVIAFFITWLVFRATPTVYRLIGESGADIISRIMGILLAAIAIGYIRVGILGVIREYRVP